MGISEEQHILVHTNWDRTIITMGGGEVLSDEKEDDVGVVDPVRRGFEEDGVVGVVVGVILVVNRRPDNVLRFGARQIPVAQHG